MATETETELRERMKKVDRWEADRLRAYFDSVIGDHEEVRHTASTAVFGSIFDKLRGIVEEMWVVQTALDSIGEWDDEEEK